MFQKFLNENLFARWRDNHWSAMPTDLIIEQVLMRSLKSKGGLTHGRGMDETQRTRWLLTMTDFAQIATEMEKLSSSKQHKSNQMPQSTMIRDSKDTAIILEYLQSHNPFQYSEYLVDISNGIASSVPMHTWQRR